jgi:predicted membrane chloride channel (bestrophin family)
MVEALTELTDKIQGWFKSETKDSKEIFPALRKMNEIAFYMANNGADKDAVKGVQENVNGLRKQLTRAYTISRTDFIKPAYILLKSLLFSVLVLLLICKFKTLTGAVLVTGFISFIFIYLYLLINGLDDPFELNREDTEVDLLPLDRFRSRLEASFQVHLNKQEG